MSCLGVVLSSLTSICVRAVGGTSADAAGSGAGGTFNPYSNKDGLEIRTGSLLGHTIIIVKGSCEVPASLRELCSFITGQGDLEYNKMMHEADAMYIDGRVLARYEGRGHSLDATGLNVPADAMTRLPTRCEYWSGFRLPWPLWSRDFLYREVTNRAFWNATTESWRIATGEEDVAGPGEREYGFTQSSSLEREDCPDLEESLKFVRAYLALGGYAFTPTPDSTVDAPKCQLTYVVLADGKGSLPGVTLLCF